MIKFIHGLIYVASFILAMQIIAWVYAIDQRYIQTDPSDIVTRQRIDRDIYEELDYLDFAIQADTVLLTGGQTADTVQLGGKYKDTDYMILLSVRNLRVVINWSVRASPLTDSSFVITKGSSDVSTLYWMTFYR